MKGYIPYRDFFEHHHPLLWYLFSPILALFLNDANVWYAARIFVLFILAIDCFFIGKICFLIRRDIEFALLSILFFLLPEVVVLEGVSFRPDGLMMCFVLSGIYFLFSFFKIGKKSHLVCSFILFFLALMALQKAVLILFPVAVVFLYHIVAYKISLRTVCFATMVFLALICLGGIALSILDLWKDYIELNWLLNMIMRIEIRYPAHLTLYYFIAKVLSLAVLAFSKNYFLRIIAFLALFTSVLFQFVFYAPYRHYWLPVYPYFAIVTAYFVAQWKEKIIGGIVLAIVLILAYLNYLRIAANMVYFGKLSTFVYLSSQVLALSREDDLIIGNTSTLGGLRFDAMGYYWFGRDYIALLDYLYFKRREFPVEDKVLKARKPKIISAVDRRYCMGADYKYTLDCRSLPTYDYEFLKHHYYNQGFIWVRKD